jgi:hypothetical protein
METLLGVIFWKLLEKAFFNAPNTFWQLEKLSDFRNYFLDTLGDTLRNKDPPYVMRAKQFGVLSYGRKHS